MLPALLVASALALPPSTSVVEQVSVADLRIRGLVSGATPRAVVALPDGRELIVQPGDRVGREGRVLQAVTPRGLVWDDGSELLVVHDEPAAAAAVATGASAAITFTGTPSAEARWLGRELDLGALGWVGGSSAGVGVIDLGGDSYAVRRGDVLTRDACEVKEVDVDGLECWVPLATQGECHHLAFGLGRVAGATFSELLLTGTWCTEVDAAGVAREVFRPAK